MVRAEDVKPSYLEYPELQTLNGQFEAIHRQFMYHLRAARDEQSRVIKLLNAQFISRLGFVGVEARDERDRAQQAIDARTAAIGGTPNACILEKQFELDYASNDAGQEFQVDARLINDELDYLTIIVFYPVAYRIQLQATNYQMRVIDKLGRSNIVTRFEETLEQFEYELIQAEENYKYGIYQLDNELDGFRILSNQIRATVFERLNSLLRNFVFYTNRIVDTLPDC